MELDLFEYFGWGSIPKDFAGSIFEGLLNGRQSLMAVDAEVCALGKVFADQTFPNSQSCSDSSLREISAAKNFNLKALIVGELSVISRHECNHTR